MMITAPYYSREELSKIVPSVFQEVPHTRTSTKYTYIPTITIVDGLEKEGWHVTQASEARIRKDQSRQGFQKHLLRFRHDKDIEDKTKVGDEVPEVVLINSHDGSSTYQLIAGLFRLVCSNGMVVTSATIDSQKFRHSGNPVDDIIEGVYRIVDELPTIFDGIEQSKALMLTELEQLDFAKSAMELKWGKIESGFNPEQVNGARRVEDAKPDLWSTFNRIQENLVKGGLKGTKIGKNDKVRNVTSREVKGIDSNIGLNKALWSLLYDKSQIATTN